MPGLVPRPTPSPTGVCFSQGVILWLRRLMFFDSYRLIFTDKQKFVMALQLTLLEFLGSMTGEYEHWRQRT